MSTVLTKEQLRSLKGQDVKTKDVPVSEWGENAVIRLCVMSGASQEAFESLLMNNGAVSQEETDQSNEDAPQAMMTEGLRWALLSRTVVDSDNNLVFESDEEAKEVIGALNYRTVTNIVMEALDLNGFRGDATGEAEKNSSGTRPAASGTGSRGNAGGQSRKHSRK